MRLSFEVRKIKRAIATQGQEFTFVRKRLNEYKEPSDDLGVDKLTLSGLYHESHKTAVITTAESSKLQSLSQGCILCLYEDYMLTPILEGDEVEISGVKYKVSGAVNLSKLNIAVDIALRIVDNGNPV